MLWLSLEDGVDVGHFKRGVQRACAKGLRSEREPITVDELKAVGWGGSAEMSLEMMWDARRGGLDCHVGTWALYWRWWGFNDHNRLNRRV